MADEVLHDLSLDTTPWQTIDPFLFCVHHDDAFPAGNDDMGPDPALLRGRQMGSDFAGIDGWRMYHGSIVPGFPAHPHRGFETVTIARRGYIDHSDSLGAAARFGRGDVQWMTAGKGIVHSEMFPLRDRDRANPAELFQIWLNLPRADKMVEPHFAMLWHERIPKLSADGATVTVIAGEIEGVATPPPPPPSSWASRSDSDVAIWLIELAPGARYALPAARGRDTVRSLYFYLGDALRIGDTDWRGRRGGVVRSDRPIELVAGAEPVELLVLQGRPIGEPIAQYGPFVMNDRAGIEAAFRDYQRTRFGGWPWPSDDPVHPRDADRFARHADGRLEDPLHALA